MLSVSIVRSMFNSLSKPKSPRRKVLKSSGSSQASGTPAAICKPAFKNLDEYLNALWNVIRVYPNTNHLVRKNWLELVKGNYISKGGINLSS